MMNSALEIEYSMVNHPSEWVSCDWYLTHTRTRIRLTTRYGWLHLKMDGHVETSFNLLEKWRLRSAIKLWRSRWLREVFHKEGPP